MKPYFDSGDGRVVIYCGDCLEVMKQMDAGSVDAVVTDQPYGTGWVRGGGERAGQYTAASQTAEWDIWDTRWINVLDAPVKAAFCPCSRIGDLLASFNGKASYRFYVKSNPRPAHGDQPSVEPILIHPRIPYGRGPQHFVAYNAFNGQVHPTQKPLVVMEWLVAGCSLEGDTVLDPFLGSGTTGVACVKLDRRFIGIEISEEYCELAVKRLKPILAQPTLLEVSQ